MTLEMTPDTAQGTDLQPAPRDPRRAQQLALKNRHSQNLARLMGERSDLRGVHALADFVDESLRWTA